MLNTQQVIHLTDNEILDGLCKAVELIENQAKKLDANVTNMQVLSAIGVLKTTIDVVIKFHEEDLL